MKVRTSITLSRSVLQRIDAVTGDQSRSQIIEDAVVEYLNRLARQARDRRDLEILDRHSDPLNQEAEDVLAYQVDI